MQKRKEFIPLDNGKPLDFDAILTKVYNIIPDIIQHQYTWAVVNETHWIKPNSIERQYTSEEKETLILDLARKFRFVHVWDISPDGDNIVGTSYQEDKCECDITVSYRPQNEVYISFRIIDNWDSMPDHSYEYTLDRCYLYDDNPTAKEIIDIFNALTKNSFHF